MRRSGAKSAQSAAGSPEGDDLATAVGAELAQDPLDPLATAEFRDGGGKDALEARVAAKIAQEIREEWIRDEVRKRSDEFTSFKDLHVFVGTWNVNGKRPVMQVEEPLEGWLSVGASGPVPDIYVCGFQELVDLTAGNVVMDSASKERSEIWTQAISEAIHRLHKGQKKYMLLARRHLVGVMVCVFVLDAHVHRIPKISIQDTVTATGIMGMGNKGGVCVRFQMYDSTFCFVCAHLAAHRDQVEARNSDYRNITTKSSFRDYAHAESERSAEERLCHPADSTLLIPDGHAVYQEKQKSVNVPIGGGLPPTTMPDFGAGMGDGGCEGTTNDGFLEEDSQFSSLNLQPVLSQPTFGITDHDYVFWLGDFNYRMRMPYSIETVFDFVDRSDLKWLRKNDQLLIEQERGNVFVGFKEAEIQFLPTYKFQTGTNQYDRRPEKKIRAPAYCDRILWREVNDSKARILRYMSCPTLTISDHKPVMALFVVKVKDKNVAKRHEVFLSIARQLDALENSARPQVELDRNMVAFEGGLTYMETREEKINVRNTGKVPVTWRFVPKMEDLTICKPWLRVEPDFGLLTPGSATEIRIVATVEANTARDVASGASLLDDILVLRLENGRDFFICVSAAMVPTSFGVSLSQLVRTHHPFAASPDDIKLCRLDREARLGEDKAKQPLKLPKEIWSLCNFLWNFDLLKVPEIFVQSSRRADPGKVRIVRRSIDGGFELVPEDDYGPSDDEGVAMAHAVAAVLLEFLHALPDPIVPFDQFPKTTDLDSANAAAWTQNFLNQLPPLNHNVFSYIITLLREVRKCQQYNEVDQQGLAEVFARALLRPSELSVKQKETSPQNNMPFDLPNWITGEKRESTIMQIAERFVLYFIQDDRTLF